MIKVGYYGFLLHVFSSKYFDCARIMYADLNTFKRMDRIFQFAKILTLEEHLEKCESTLARYILHVPFVIIFVSRPPFRSLRQCRARDHNSGIESIMHLEIVHNPGISEHRDDNDILIRKEQIQKFTSQILESE
uniref:Uncharacterized protein n=1 Tax=Romanomermis culicivorax TaxID=13658 RepID=A0A915L267_ROMCU